MLERMEQKFQIQKQQRKSVTFEFETYVLSIPSFRELVAAVNQTSCL